MFKKVKRSYKDRERSVNIDLFDRYFLCIFGN